MIIDSKVRSDCFDIYPFQNKYIDPNGVVILKCVYTACLSCMTLP